MSQKTIQLLFFGLITIGVSVLLFFTFKPYLGVIFLAGVLAVVFYPLYKKLLYKFNFRKSLASLVTTFLIFAFIIVPGAILSAFLIKETVDLYNFVSLGGAQDIVSQANFLLNQLDDFLPHGLVDSQINLEVYARGVLDWVINHFDSIFVIVFGGVLNFILMLISLYYFFIFGDKIRSNLITWSPLPDEQDKDFIEVLRSSMDAVLRGRVLVAAIQGFLIGVGFAIFGVGSPVLWGFVGGIASLVPVLGTSVVTIPAVLFLFLTNHFWAGLGLLVWGALIVGLADNFLSVVFLKNKIKVHPLIVLFSILGGVEVFGAIGFLVGPVVVSAFIALLNIYPFIMLSYKKKDLML
ncbi:MAG: AI-2E family transporter [Parcubacteria group bacterium]|nr:AI-2E family transporter [Parcubacteria group bacterium]